MGAVSAIKSTDWELVDYDTNIEISEDSNGSLQYKEHSILVRQRRHQAVSDFSSSKGTTGSNLGFTNGGATELYTASGATYVCTADRLRPDPAHVDFWLQVQTWEYLEDWQAVPASWIN